jgi:hypothetical protein
MNEVEDLYNENYKSLKKQINKDIRRWSHPCSWIDKINIAKMAECNPYSLHVLIGMRKHLK